MSLFVPTLWLLFFLSSLPVACGRSPSSLQGDKDHRLGREDHPHPGHTVRRPKVEEGGLKAVIDVSDDNDNKPDSAGEYTGASLTKPGMPADFTICGAFKTEAWTTDTTAAYLFRLNGRDGQLWGYVYLTAAITKPEYVVKLGELFVHLAGDSLWFPLTWTRVCVSLDSVSGIFRLVVDGQLVQERCHQEVREEDKNRPSNLNMTLGYNIDMWGFAQEITGRLRHYLFSDLLFY